MSIKLPGATNGSVEIDVPAAIGSDLSVTIPAIAGEILVADASGDVETSATGTGGSSGSALIAGYQQGTWTPTLSHGTVGTAICTWSRIGNAVTLAANLSNFSDTSTAVNISITGIPYARNDQFVIGTIRTSYLNYGEGSSPHSTLNSGDIIRVGVSTPSIGATPAPAAGYVDYSNFITAQASNTQLVFNITYYTNDTTWTPQNGATVS